MASNPELEASILADPDDVARYLVYADWLQAQGDPRGELISLQHARLQRDSAELRAREAALLKSQPQVSLGDLEPLISKGLSVTWRLGFLHTVRVARDRFDSTLDVAGTLAQVLASPSAKFVSEVTIGLCHTQQADSNFQAAVDVLAARRPPLRRLFIGDFEYPELTEMSWVDLGDLSALPAALPHLRSLRLRGGSMQLGTLSFPGLRDFTVETGGLPQTELAALCAAKWPLLERLEVWFGAEDYGCDCEFEDLTPLLEGTGRPALRHLGLVNTSLISRHINELADAGVLSQLESLDLSLGTLDDEDAEALVRCRSSFAHLKQLNVRENFLTPRGLFLASKTVKDLGPSSLQRAAPTEERYVGVGE
jgi:uncharacterized protein (TIGR02996 family)